MSFLHKYVKECIQRNLELTLGKEELEEVAERLGVTLYIKHSGYDGIVANHGDLAEAIIRNIIEEAKKL